jgi:hypothetical protein
MSESYSDLIDLTRRVTALEWAKRQREVEELRRRIECLEESRETYSDARRAGLGQE